MNNDKQIDIRALFSLRFTHAAALSRALDTLKSHDVFGGIPATESNACDICRVYIEEILSGKCPILPKEITTTESLEHHRSRASFDQTLSACIEAFQTVFMENATRAALRREYQGIDFSSNKQIGSLLYDDVPDVIAVHRSICDCTSCKESTL